MYFYPSNNVGDRLCFLFGRFVAKGVGEMRLKIGIVSAVMLVGIAAWGEFELPPVEATETTTVLNIEDLRTLLRNSQKSWMAISPPSTEMIY